MKTKIESKPGWGIQFKPLVVTSCVGIILLLSLFARGAGVVNNCTEPDLRAAMAGGGTVTFACDGTIMLANTITNALDAVLDGSGHQITISGNNACRVFSVATNVNFTIIGLTIANGRSDGGAGIYNNGGTLTAAGCDFVANLAQGAQGYTSTNGTPGQTVCGGALYNAGNALLYECSFISNSAAGGAGAPGVLGYLVGGNGGNGGAGGDADGGAIGNSGSLIMTGCLLANNSAIGGMGGNGGNGKDALDSPGVSPGDGGSGASGGNGDGGAVCNNGSMILINNTIALNLGAGGQGGYGGVGGSSYYWFYGFPGGSDGTNGSPGLSIGGICDASGQCHLTNCTVVFNSGTGIRTTGTNGTKLINTLLAVNSPGGNDSGEITDLGYNLSSDTTCNFTNTGSLNNTYPLLGSLTNNGGPTLTVALLPGCRAIDAADTAAAPPTDQRGVARPFGIAADIGAYEFNEATNPGPSMVVTECSEAGLLVAMSGGGHVTFACDGTIQLSNSVIVTMDTFLDASGHRITLQGNGTRIFQVSSNVTFALANLAVTGASIQIAGGFMNATNCLFSGNSAASGGAILNENGGVCLSACVFTNNRAVNGGALDNSGTLMVDLCTFVANSALGTDGDRAGVSGSDAMGGAILNLGTLTVTRSSFTNNFVVAGSGLGGSSGGYPFGFDGRSGGAGGNAEGGALYNAGTARVFNSTFDFNSGRGGNGGAGGTGWYNNPYGGPGGNGGSGGWGGTGVGALFNSGEVLQIVNCTFTFNTGSAGRGGMGGDGGGGDPGSSGGSGGNGGSGIGALYSPFSSCQITNCTFAGNSGTSGTGGNGGTGGETYSYPPYSGPDGQPGSAGSGTGGIRTSGGMLINTILALNSPGGNGAGTIIDLGHNLSSDSTCAFTSAGSLNNTDPLLGPLADNGGPMLTMALLPGSPAINAGDPYAAPPTDQRGVPRPQGPGVDIGAFEYQYVPIFTGARFQTPTNFWLQMSGLLPGKVFTIQSSMNFADWFDVTNFTAGESLFYEFVDASSGTDAMRFYRLKLANP